MPGQDFAKFGGQAILEGVMMRSPNYYSVACRAPNGKIVVNTEAVEKTWIGRQKWLRLPFLRGSFAILDGMVLGHKAMNFAGNIQVEDKYQPEGAEAPAPPKPIPLWILLVVIALAVAGALLIPDLKPMYKWCFYAVATVGVMALPPFKKALGKHFEQLAVPIAMVAGLGLGLFIFDFIPQFFAQLIGKGFDEKGTITNYIAEVFKIIIFLGYLGLIAKIPAIKELFKYHGAEHKAINALELVHKVDVESSRAQTRLHPRCGTSFMVIVLLVGFLVMPLVPRYPITGKPDNVLIDTLARFGIGFLFLPVIAGISYELLKMAGKFRDQRWVNYAFAPGLLSQDKLTTVEPETPHLEVAVASLNAVLKAEQTSELTKTDDYDAAPINDLDLTDLEIKPRP